MIEIRDKKSLLFIHLGLSGQVITFIDLPNLKRFAFVVRRHYITLKKHLQASKSPYFSQIFTKYPAACWMTEFTQRFGFYLTNSLPGHIEVIADFFKRVIFSINQAKP